MSFLERDALGRGVEYWFPGSKPVYVWDPFFLRLIARRQVRGC